MTYSICTICSAMRVAAVTLINGSSWPSGTAPEESRQRLWIPFASPPKSPLLVSILPISSVDDNSSECAWTLHDIWIVGHAHLSTELQCAGLLSAALQAETGSPPS